MPQDTMTEPRIDDPQVARAQIERTRARMSDTIDEIEGVLLRKKEEIQDRLDVAAPIRERPIPSLGIALGAGLVLGFLTGGDDEDDVRHRGYHAELEERAATWEMRARRVMRIAQEQEAVLQRLGATGGAADEVDWNPDPRFAATLDEDDPEHYRSHPAGSSRLDEVRDMISDRVSTYLGDTIRQLFAPQG